MPNTILKEQSVGIVHPSTFRSVVVCGSIFLRDKHILFVIILLDIAKTKRTLWHILDDNRQSLFAKPRLYVEGHIVIDLLTGEADILLHLCHI